MKHRVLAILLCFATVLTMVMPGTLAVYADEDSSESQPAMLDCICWPEDGIHADFCPLNEQPDSFEEEIDCICWPEDGIHADFCPLYEQPDSFDEEIDCICWPEDGIHADFCPLNEQPDSFEEEIDCICWTEDGIHADFCPLNEQPDSFEEEIDCICWPEDGIHEEYCPLFVDFGEEPEGTPPENWGSASLEGAVSFTNVAPLMQFDYDLATMELYDYDYYYDYGYDYGFDGYGYYNDYGTSTVADNNGVVLNKTATPNANGGFDITLEAYVTGEQTTVSHYDPADIVLVLDISGSMNYAMDNTDQSSYTPVYGSSTADSGGSYAYGLDTSKANYYYVKNSSDTFVRLSYNAQAGDTKQGWFTDADWRGTRIQPTTSANDTNKNRTQVYVVAQGGSRLDVLKDAVNQFIDDTLQTSEDSRIAVVSFSGKIDEDYPPKSTRVSDFSSNRSALQTAVSNLVANGATYSNYGMQEAVTLLQGLNNDRKKVVVMFTDGAPSEKNDFSDDVANGAISASRTMKQAGVTVYTIGVFAGANGSLKDFGEDSSDTNKYMHYVSSNYPDAESMETPGSVNGELGEDESYYLSASSAEDLMDIFVEISNQVGGATNTTLDSSTVVKDIIAPSFTVPKGADDIKIYTADCTGSEDGVLTFATPVETEDVTAEIDDATLTVSGFDFSANWCGWHSSEYGGKKLIIEFTVSPKEGFLGGNNVPTNGENSGLYSNGNPVGLFEVPTVDVPIGEITIEANDKNVYLTQVPTEEQLKSDVTIKCGDVDITDPSNLEDWQKDYVNIETSFTKSDGFDGTKDGTYTVTATVSPKTEGDYNKPETVVTAKTATKEMKINVFKPELTYKDSDVYYGDDAPTDDDGNLNFTGNLTKTEWKHGDTLSTAEGVEMIGTAPTLDLTYTPEEGKIVDGKINSKQDIAVDVSVKIGTTNVNDYTNIIHTTCDNTCTDPEDGKFWLHVKTCQLTIKKEGGADKESYVFDVYKDGTKYTEVTIWGNGSVTIYELPVGKYTIEENTGWSWRYNVDNGSAVTLSKDNTSGTITCTNTRTINNWLNGFSTIVKNVFVKLPETTNN